MIDLHSHLLPGVDDGPSTMEEALTLARLAVSNGIKHAVLTPHIHVGRHENQHSSLNKVFDEFQRSLQLNEINLSISQGAEVRVSFEIISLLEQGEVPMLGREDGYDIMLIEFPHSQVLPGTDKFIKYLLGRKIRPMIAHPERNKVIMHSLEALQPFVEMGCLVQLTAGSVCGHFGPDAKACAHKILKKGWVSVLATDAHNVRHRPPDLEPGRAVAERLIGKKAADALVFDRPATIIGHQIVGQL